MSDEHAPLHVVVLKPLPRLYRLVGVTPIAQAQERHGVEVLALALERYDAGFVVGFQVQSLGQGPRLGGDVALEEGPRLALTATDDRGGRYRVALEGQTGAGQRREWQWRVAYRSDPTLDPAARELHLTIATLTWTRPDERVRRFVPVQTVAGPWSFVVALVSNLP